MKNQISFMSGLFDADQNVAGDRNLGEDLAKWMLLKSSGSEFVFSTPVKSADGWAESVTANGENFVLKFDAVRETIGDEYAGWTITIDKPRSWGVFGSKDSPSRGRLCDLIHNILRDERQIREVQWG